jgi:vacuolar protein sorting-associated protein 45
MQKEVYLFERIDSGATREPIHFLKCVVFVRPTPENIQLLIEELRAPRYVQYYICELFPSDLLKLI